MISDRSISKPSPQELRADKRTTFSTDTLSNSYDKRAISSSSSSSSSRWLRHLKLLCTIWRYIVCVRPNSRNATRGHRTSAAASSGAAFAIAAVSNGRCVPPRHGREHRTIPNMAKRRKSQIASDKRYVSNVLRKRSLAL